MNLIENIEKDPFAFFINDLKIHMSNVNEFLEKKMTPKLKTQKAEEINYMNNLCFSKSKRKLEANLIYEDWNEEDEAMLEMLVIKYKFDWKKIAKRFTNVRRKIIPPTELRDRFKKTNALKKKKRTFFNHEEDLKIVNGIMKHGRKWVEIAAALPNRSPITIRNRYYSFLRNDDIFEKLSKELNLSESYSYIKQLDS